MSNKTKVQFTIKYLLQNIFYSVSSVADLDPHGSPSFKKRDLEPHQIGKLDPDQSEKIDPDPHQSEKVEAVESHFGALEDPSLASGSGSRSVSV